jgi:hypothetical protein
LTGGVAGDRPVVGGRGHLNSGEDRGGAGQRVAQVASLGPSGCAELVGWLGDRAEGGARRRQQWGSRQEAYSGEQVEWLGLHVGVQAYWVREEAIGVLNWPRAQAEQGAHRRRQWRPRRCSGARARKDDWAFISGREAVVWIPCPPRRVVVEGSWYGRGTAERAATYGGRQASGARRCRRPAHEGGARGTGLRL